MSHKSYASRKREPFTFDVDGEPAGQPFKTRGGIGSMVLELGELARLKDLDAESPEGMSAIAQIFSMLLGAEEYERFRTFVAEHDVDADVLLEILQDMFTSVVGHPLSPPSDSSSGPTNTPRTLKVISSSDNSVREIPLTPEREAELIAEMERDLTPGIG